MKVSITGTRSELRGILARWREASAAENVHINLAGQQANSLLHDGHAWKGFARTALTGTRRAMRSARTDGAPMLVHASFAFVHAVERGARLEEPLRSSVDAILECEALALSGPVPACVVRLGYPYGPQSGDLRAYRIAFRLGRPYWSGPREVAPFVGTSFLVS
jgi:nucleoside-diphosphate-sugar epimerase